MNIVLDMDGTLINEDSGSTTRPHLKTFLKACFDICDNVSIWTASDKIWFDEMNKTHFQPILDELKEEFDFVYHSDHCSRSSDPNPESFYPVRIITKSLKKVWKKEGYTKHNTLIVDNTPDTYKYNYGNAIPIKTYLGGDDDDRLLQLSKFLPKLKSILTEKGTIRYVEKRYY